MSGRWRILLLISLAVNLFLAGLVAARLLPSWTPGEPARLTGRGQDSSLSALTPDRRRALFEAVRRASQENRPLLRQVREARRSAARRFAAEPYDATAVAAELARANALELQIRRNVEASVLAYGGGLTLEERRAVAPLLERGLRRGLRGDRGRGGGDRRSRPER